MPIILILPQAVTPNPIKPPKALHNNRQIHKVLWNCDIDNGTLNILIPFYGFDFTLQVVDIVNSCCPLIKCEMSVIWQNVSLVLDNTTHSSTSHYKQKHRKRNKFHVHQCQGWVFLKNHNIAIDSMTYRALDFKTRLYHSPPWFDCQPKSRWEYFGF